MSDDLIRSRSRSLFYRNPYLRQIDVNRYGEYLSYSTDKHRRDRFNQRRIFDDEYSSDTSSEDEIDYSRFHRSPLRRDRFYHSATDVYRACQVIINYGKDSLVSSKSDEILIKQNQNNDGEIIIVYKGYLKKGDTFTFKSQRFVEYPFDVKFYINGHIEAHLLACCEYKYHQGGFRVSQSFLIEHVEKSIPCRKCQRWQDRENQENIPMSSSDTKKVLSDHRSLKTNRHRIKSEERTINNPIQSTTATEQQDKDESSTRKNEIISSAIDEKQTTKAEQENEKTEDTNEPVETENPAGQFHRMLMERATTDNTGGFFQSLLALLQNGLRRREARKPLPARYEGNVENFVVILFGVKDESNLIKSIVNFVKIFDNIKELNSFIESLTVEKVILIVTDPFAESIEDPSKFESIYLISSNVAWKNDHSNIRGNFPNIESTFERIKEENDFFFIEFVSTNETKNPRFTYSVLLKETLLMNDTESNLKQDFLDYCRFHYKDNKIELNLIDQFEKDFQIENSISWFRKNCFLRKMLNRCLRTEEIDILFKMRWFIQILNQQIKENNLSNLIYRIHYISSNDFQNLKEQTFLSFGTFLECTRTEPSIIQSIQGMETILFRIQTTIGEFDLLPFDIVYQIESIEKTDHHYWIINLRNINKDNEQLKELTNEIREEIEGPVVLIQLAKLLLTNNDYLHVDYLARLLFNDGSLKHNPTLLASLAAVHHLLGSVDNRENNHRAARLQFEQSLQIFLTFIPEDNQILSATYNNIGSMFYQEDQHEQAIIYHQKALQCQLKSSSPDIEAIATYSGNIGAVYLDQKKYDQALINYKRSLQILQQSIPDQESLSIAMVSDRIAAVYWRMDKPNEALPFYERALQLELKYLPDTDHKISVSYFNLSTAYARLNRLDDAIDAAEKSIQQLLKTVPPDHPEIKENTEQLEGLRRKKWLQQLYQ